MADKTAAPADAAPPAAPKKLTKKELRILERQKAAVRSALPRSLDTFRGRI